MFNDETYICSMFVILYVTIKRAHFEVGQNNDKHEYLKSATYVCRILEVTAARIRRA